MIIFIDKRMPLFWILCIREICPCWSDGPQTWLSKYNGGQSCTNNITYSCTPYQHEGTTTIYHQGPELG